MVLVPGLKRTEWEIYGMVLILKRTEWDIYGMVLILKRTEWEIYGTVLVPVTTDAGECDTTYEFFFTIK